MAENTNEETSERPAEKQAENAPASTVPVPDTIPDKKNQEKENMEVHHHSHHEGKKNWKSYLWEFLMLFLAVFCGFLAEYQLEHKIEKDRAEELAKSFYQELKNDSATAVIKVKNRIKQEEALRYLIKYFKDSNLTAVPKQFAINFEYGINFRSPTVFEPRDIVLQQLQNSGSLRYFKNEQLQNLIGDLIVAIKNINNRQELEFQVRNEHVNPLIINHYDFDFDETMKANGQTIFDGLMEYESSNRTVPFHINSLDKFDRQHAVNVLNTYRANTIMSTRQVHIQKYIEINAQLLQTLRNEYHME